MNLGTILRAILIGTAVKGWAESDKDTRKSLWKIALTVSGWFFLVAGIMGGLWGPPNDNDWFWFMAYGGATVIAVRREPIWPRFLWGIGWVILVNGVWELLTSHSSSHWLAHMIMGGVLAIGARSWMKPRAETEPCDGSTGIQSTSPTKTNGPQKSG